LLNKREESSTIAAASHKTVQGKISDFVQRSRRSSTSIEQQSSESLDSTKNGVTAQRHSASGGGIELSGNSGKKAVTKRKKEESDNYSTPPSSPQLKKSTNKAPPKLVNIS